MTERAGLHTGTAFQDGRTVWPLSAAELLVVDDSDGGVSKLEIDPDKIKAALIVKLGNDFLSLMKGRRSLWVAGTNNRAKLWQELVAGLLTDGDLARVGKMALRDDLQRKIRAGRLCSMLARFRRGHLSN